MDKRVESRQADCLDGGSTPPSSTKKERTFVLSFFVELTLKHPFRSHRTYSIRARHSLQAASALAYSHLRRWTLDVSQF